MENKIVYVVTSGEYSDYNIDAIFDSKELAEQYIDFFKKKGQGTVYGGFYGIEEYELNPLQKYINGGYGSKVGFQIVMERNGDILGIYKASPYEYTKCEANNIEMFSLANGITRANIFLFAKDKGHAIKIAGERRTQILANDQWKVTEQ